MSTLSDLWKSTVQGVRGVAGDIVAGQPATRTQNAAPAPDLVAKAATPGAIVIASDGIGVAKPLLIIGAIAIVALIVARR